MLSFGTRNNDNDNMIIKYVSDEYSAPHITLVAFIKSCSLNPHNSPCGRAIISPVLQIRNTEAHTEIKQLAQSHPAEVCTQQ